MLVGLSFSLCIQDILQGDIDERLVLFLATGTKMTDEADWETVLASSCASYWRRNPAEGRRIAQRLRPKLVQLRLLGIEPPYLGQGHWAQVRPTRMIT